VRNQHDCGNGGCGHEWGDSTIPCWLRRRPQKFLLSIAICSVLAAASVERAWATDWPGAAPVLRGSVSPGYVRWDGWQAGIQAGFGNMKADFGNSTSSLVAFILRNSTLEAEGGVSTWTTLPSNTTTGPVFGGVRRLQLAMERTRCRVGSRLQASSEPEFNGQRFAQPQIRHFR
jgi:hypothetical protein